MICSIRSTRLLIGCLVAVGALLFLSTDGQAEPPSSPLLQPGDRVAILGGTFVERAQRSGMIEAVWQCLRPDWKLSVRNIGWSGDNVHGIARKRFDGPEQGFERLLEDVRVADPSVVLVAYGFAEASDGPEAVERFEPGLRRLVEALKSQQRRVILVTPVAMPGFRVEGYRDAIQACREIVSRVGNAMSVPVVSIDWQPTDDQLTEDRLLPNAEGYRAFAAAISEPLIGPGSCEQIPTGLPELIAAKNELFFHRYRPQNETYLFLFRKREQGNNAVEVPQFDPLVEKADQQIWAAAGRE